MEYKIFNGKLIIITLKCINSKSNCHKINFFFNPTVSTSLILLSHFTPSFSGP